jgi:geranylgeranylglycerol-phosphate geranylgeranyltransferase
LLSRDIKSLSIAIRQKLKGAIQILRPELPLAAGLCVVIGAMLGLGSFPHLNTTVLGFVLGFCLSGSALIFNDYFDLEVDRINAPHRPLPSGLLSRLDVVLLGIFTALIGLAAAWAFSPFVSGLSLVTWIVGFLYNWKLKATGIWGNLMVSLSVAMTFLIGAIAVGQANNRMVWVFASFAFFFDLAEEIAADAMDVEGDQKIGSQSIAILHGRQRALRISAILFGLVVMISLLPVLWGEAGLAYLIPISITDIMIIYFAIKLLRSQSPAEGRWSIRGLYLSASLGLFAFLLGTFIA